MSKELDALLKCLDLEQVDTNHFRGHSLPVVPGRIYGGQSLAQAVWVAQRGKNTDHILHSCHSYFLSLGNPENPVDYRIENLNDGKSFSTRQVFAKQNKRPIFTMTLSFHKKETGFFHQRNMPETPGYENLSSDEFRYNQLRKWKGFWPLEFRTTDPEDLNNPEPLAPKSHVWFKASGKLPDDQDLHQAIFAYASDSPILKTAMRPHAINEMTKGIQVATIDHAIWYHRPFKVDEWLLFVSESDIAFGARGFVRACIYNKQGELVASVAQEGLIRNKKL